MANFTFFPIFLLFSGADIVKLMKAKIIQSVNKITKKGF